MAGKIEIGSIVRLKLGGPNMKVEAMFSRTTAMTTPGVRCEAEED
jgi:uncharacterized protein YodC (DUF2158 family)